MTNLEKKIIWPFIITILIVVLVIIVNLMKFDETNENHNSNLNVITGSQTEQNITTSVSPTGEYMAVLENNMLEIVNIKSGEEHTIQEYTTDEKIHSLFWTSDGRRLYYAQTRYQPLLVTDFAYLDVSGDYKFISTGITPSVATDKADTFMNELFLIGVKEDIIYFQSSDHIYKLSVYGEGDNGGEPQLIVDSNIIFIKKSNDNGQLKFSSEFYNFYFMTTSEYEYSAYPILGAELESYMLERINSDTSEQVNRDTPNGFNTAADDRIGLIIYLNDQGITVDDVDAFQSWQETASPSSGISETPVVKRFTNVRAIEAITASGIDAFSRTFYFISDDYIIEISSADVSKEELYEIADSFNWTSSDINTNLNSSQNINTISAIPEDWQTVSSNIYAYEISFPEGWYWELGNERHNSSTDVPATDILISPDQCYFTGDCVLSSEILVRLEVSNMVCDTSQECADYLDFLPGCITYSDRILLTIDNYEATQQFEYPEEDCATENFFGANIFWKKGNDTFRLIGETITQEVFEKYSDVFQQISQSINFN
ncbi:MAG: hypothetical protein Q8P20_10835 [bacterium]|nr:hypothetical protein [bacterium]